MMPIQIPQVTLDTNCLIDLAEHRPSEASVRKLAQFNGSTLRLQIPGIGASERLPGGGRLENFAKFMELLRELQLESAAILRPMGYFGVSYYDWCVYSDSTMVADERRIHEILFPNIEFGYAAFCAKRGIDPKAEPLDGRWLNAKCDVQGLWCHLNEGGGIFVTNDGNFHKATKKPALERLGVGRIASPDDAVSLLGL